MSDASLLVAIAALVISAISLGVSVLTFRADGPRLRLQVSRADGDPFPDGYPVKLTVVNSGRASVTVESFHVTALSLRKPLEKFRSVEGPPLPFRLDAHASESWVVDALPVALALDRKADGRLEAIGGTAQHQFAVAAGNGSTVRASNPFVALRIIADARRE